MIDLASWFWSLGRFGCFSAIFTNKPIRKRIGVTAKVTDLQYASISVGRYEPTHYGQHCKKTGDDTEPFQGAHL